MRKWLIYLEFFLLCGFFVIIPLFLPSPDINTISLNLSPMIIILACLSFYLYYRYEYSLSERQNRSFLIILFNSGKVFTCFGILVLINVVLSLISHISYLKNGIFSECFSNQITLDLKDFNFLTGISGFIKFFISAFWEETLYRLFFPTALLIFSGNFRSRFLEKRDENGICKNEKFLKIYDIGTRCIVELLCVVIFAVGHRYLGRIAVLNALLCGIVLRIFYLKNKSILYSFSAHFLYNIFILLLTIVLKN